LHFSNGKHTNDAAAFLAMLKKTIRLKKYSPDFASPHVSLMKYAGQEPVRFTFRQAPRPKISE
jgi:hypothetical protein